MVLLHFNPVTRIRLPVKMPEICKGLSMIMVSPFYLGTIWEINKNKSPLLHLDVLTLVLYNSIKLDAFVKLNLF